MQLLKKPDSRQLLGLAALLCFAALGVALVSQYVFDMPPCAWCVMQRLAYLAIGLLCLLALALDPAPRRACAGAGLLLACAGVAAAWYQYSVAANMFSCDQTFADRFMTGLGLDAAVPWLFGIYASCMDAVVHVLGIEYAIWSLSLFVLLGALLAAALLRGGGGRPARP
ncbi:disulfide bond formation protein B [Orrella sp. JC864]|uniref:disulfide bond formation protein B n=1 Tax=Orrella sp. JC864 TaxID=3120298 RepID=UPI0012BB978E